MGPGRDHQPVEGQVLAPVQQQAAPLDVESGGRNAEDPLCFEPLLDVQCYVVRTGLSGQDLFRQRGPVVGQVAFGSHDRHRPGMADVAKGFGRPQPGQRTPDHDRSALHGRRPYRLRVTMGR